MAYVSDDFRTLKDAPVGQWCATRASSKPPYVTKPPRAEQKGSHFAGQCVSYPTRACRTLPVGVRNWIKGKQV